MMIDKRIITHFDFLLPFLLLPLIVISYVLISEVSPSQNIRQTIYVLFGIAAFCFVFFLPFRQANKMIIVFYWVCILLLILVLVAGTKQLGAQRWLTIGAFSLQPSEPVKVAIILLLGLHISTNPPPPKGYGIKQFCILSFYILLPFVLILLQPDLGTALVVLFMGFGTLFLIGVNPRIWITLIMSVLIASPLIYGSLKDYQKKRIHDFIGDNQSYHVKQSIITIGSGGILGKKKEESTQTQLKFLPIATSDFIFAYFVERWGFLGAILLLGLYGVMILHILSFCFMGEKDYRLRTTAAAVAMLLFFYVSVNIGMTIDFAPVVGIPLPLMSYGGSSFITFMVLFGILENMLAFRFSYTNSQNPLKAIVRKRKWGGGGR